MLPIGLDTEIGTRTDRRLRNDLIAWLTSAGADGTPQPTPVWFPWDAETVLVYSKPGQATRNNPRTSLSLNRDANAGDFVVLIGGIAVDPSARRIGAVPAYFDNYGSRLLRIGMAPEAFAVACSVTERLRPDRLRDH